MTSLWLLLNNSYIVSMILFRLALICLIIYLIIRSFVRHGVEEELSRRNNSKDGRSEAVTRGVSKETGEFIDYEEVD